MGNGASEDGVGMFGGPMRCGEREMVLADQGFAGGVSCDVSWSRGREKGRSRKQQRDGMRANRIM